jgi:hypothetical protein
VDLGCLAYNNEVPLFRLLGQFPQRFLELAQAVDLR